RAQAYRPDATFDGHHQGMPPPLRRDVPDDREPVGPRPAPARRPRDPSLPPRDGEPNRANSANHPFAMAVSGCLEVISGVAALLTVLMALGSLHLPESPEGMLGFSMAFLSLPLAGATILMLVVTSLLYAWCGASRHARILGILAALATAASCAWL